MAMLNNQMVTVFKTTIHLDMKRFFHNHVWLPERKYNNTPLKLQLEPENMLSLLVDSTTGSWP